MKFWTWVWENFPALLFLLAGVYLMVFVQDYDNGQFALIMGSIGILLGEVRELRGELNAAKEEKS